MTDQRVGPFGLKFAQIQFPGASASGFDLTKFSVTIPDRTVRVRVHGKSVTAHFLDAPTTCNRSWQFEQTNTFSDAPPLTATDSQPCTKH